MPTHSPLLPIPSLLPLSPRKSYWSGCFVKKPTQRESLPGVCPPCFTAQRGSARQEQGEATSAAERLPSRSELLGWRSLTTDEWSPAGASPLRPPAREKRQHRVSGVVVPQLGASEDLGLGDCAAFLCVCMCRGSQG